MTIDMTSCTIQGRRQRHAELAGLGAEIQAGCVIFVDVNIMCPYLDAADDRFCVTLLLEQTGLEGQWQKPEWFACSVMAALASPLHQSFLSPAHVTFVTCQPELPSPTMNSVQ
jgi:hypothetical protein